MIDDEKAAKILQALVDLSGGSCTISEQEITEAGDSSYGEILAGILILHEMVSHQKKTIEEQNRKIGLTSKLAALGEMAGGIAHEINSPLAAVAEGLRLMEKQYRLSGAEIKNFDRLLQRSSATVDKIAAIIKGLRATARDGETAPFEKSVLGVIVQDVLVLVRKQIERRGIELKVADHLNDIEVECQVAPFAQVLLNLLNNARDAIEENQKSGDKWIEIKADKQKGRVQIQVINSGPKISQDVVGKIFDPFFTTKDIGKGTGLGLSVSRSTIQNHEGLLSLDTSASHTTFIVNLPAEQSRQD